MKANKRPRILIVDDETSNLKLVSTILKSHGYFFETAENGLEALAKTKEISPDLIFLDIMMRGMDGFEVCRRLKEDPHTQRIPVVMVTALSERKARIKGLKTGANDFITKPYDSTEIMLRAKNLIKVKEYEDLLVHYNQQLEREVQKRTKQIRAALRELKKSKDELKASYMETIHTLTTVAEYRDEETASHIRRIGHYCKIVAKELGWSEEDQETILFASPLHDIGKVGIPAEILLKQAKLTPEEYTLMKTHAMIGARILQRAKPRYI